MVTEPGLGWKETYLAGSQAKEESLIRKFAADINRIQTEYRDRARPARVLRCVHAKIHLGTCQAQFEVLPEIPTKLRIGLFQPDSRYHAEVRFSNASGAVRPDAESDLRGIAIRVWLEDGRWHDLLMTNATASHEKNAREFMVFTGAAAAGSKFTMVLKLLSQVGPWATIRMLRIIEKQTSRPVYSLATEQFWSRAAYAFGPYALKFSLKPHACGQHNPRADQISPNYLAEDLRDRLAAGGIGFDFNVQLFVDEKRTPIEDNAVEWLEADSQPITIARLRILQQDLSTSAAKVENARIDGLAFNPWNVVGEVRPLGSMNRARRLVYESSALLRSATAKPRSVGSNSTTETRT
jgi:catalase